ncbi:hypothetical protein FOA52_016179 [Chlamydomonas sp. UWO 241]|nr:hypothetical protein FOA52_016179 [Chlamydomonas sp. UWO 241]
MRSRHQRVVLASAALSEEDRVEIAGGWEALLGDGEESTLTYMHLIKAADAVLGRDDSSARVADLKRALELMDLDGNGKIESYEFKAYMMANWNSASKDAAAAMAAATTLGRRTTHDNKVVVEDMICIGSMRFPDLIKAYRRRVRMAKFMREADESANAAIAAASPGGGDGSDGGSDGGAHVDESLGGGGALAESLGGGGAHAESLGGGGARSESRGGGELGRQSSGARAESPFGDGAHAESLGGGGVRVESLGGGGARAESLGGGKLRRRSSGAQVGLLGGGGARGGSPFGGARVDESLLGGGPRAESLGGGKLRRCSSGAHMGLLGGGVRAELPFGGGVRADESLLSGGPRAESPGGGKHQRRSSGTRADSVGGGVLGGQSSVVHAESLLGGSARVESLSGGELGRWGSAAPHIHSHSQPVHTHHSSAGGLEHGHARDHGTGTAGTYAERLLGRAVSLGQTHTHRAPAPAPVPTPSTSGRTNGSCGGCAAQFWAGEKAALEAQGKASLYDQQDFFAEALAHGRRATMDEGSSGGGGGGLLRSGPGSLLARLDSRMTLPTVPGASHDGAAGRQEHPDDHPIYSGTVSHLPELALQRRSIEAGVLAAGGSYSVSSDSYSPPRHQSRTMARQLSTGNTLAGRASLGQRPDDHPPGHLQGHLLHHLSPQLSTGSASSGRRSIDCMSLDRLHPQGAASNYTPTRRLTTATLLSPGAVATAAGARPPAPWAATASDASSGGLLLSLAKEHALKALRIMAD